MRISDWGSDVCSSDRMLSLDRLVAIALIWAFLACASWFVRREGPSGNWAPWLAVLAGLVGARAAYVSVHWDAFRTDPLSILVFWLGGFLPLGGIVLSVAAHAFWFRGGRI